MATPVTGQSAQASTVIDIATLSLGAVQKDSLQCANFVSKVFKDAGLSSVVPASGWVPTLVNQAAGKTSTDITSAQPGDLIVFGNQEHVMIYKGAGQVIGTATVAPGVTKVIQTDWNNITTVSGINKPTLVIHTNLDNSSPLGSTSAQQVFDAAQLQTSVRDIVQSYSTAGKTYGQLIADNPQANGTTVNWSKLTTTLNRTPSDPILWTDVIILGGSGAIKDIFLQGTASSIIDAAKTITDPLASMADIAASIAKVLGKLTNAANWLHLGAMLAGVGLVGFGMWTVTKDLNETGPQGLVSPMPIMLKEGA